jgi:hypothetical protein
MLPELYYEDQIWNMKKTIDEAYKLYANRMKSYRQLTDDEEVKIKEYLDSISENGFVMENVTTTIVTMSWKVA